MVWFRSGLRDWNCDSSRIRCLKKNETVVLFKNSSNELLLQRAIQNNVSGKFDLKCTVLSLFIYL